MKWLISIILSISLMFSMGYTSMAASLIQQEVKISGVTMSSDNFKSSFGVAPEKQVAFTSIIDVENARTMPEIIISDVTIKEDAITLKMQFTSGGESVVLPITGKLGASFKNELGTNSVIIQVEDLIKGYDILLFEIYNDVDDNNLLINKTLDGKPHIKVYMQDSDKNIYLFESALPYVFANLKAENYKKADKYSDAFWAIDLVECEIKTTPINNELLEKFGLSSKTRGLSQWTVTNLVSNAYTHSFTVGGQTAECISIPYVSHRHTNVTSASSTWGASFKIDESMIMGGDIYHGTNVFEYVNVKLAFACGNNTTILSTRRSGRVFDSGSNNSKSEHAKIDAFLLNHVVESISPIIDAGTILSNMVSQRGTVKLGDDYVTLANGLLTGAGEALDQKYRLQACTDYNNSTNIGDYFTYHAEVTYESSNIENGETSGKLQVEFQEFYEPTLSLGTRYSVLIDLPYTVSE